MKDDNEAHIEVSEKDILDQAYARKSKRYQPSVYKDTNLHNNLLHKIVNIDKGRLLVIEENSTKLKYFNTHMELENEVCPKLKSKFESLGVILDLAHNPISEIVGIITSNKRIIFYETNYGKRHLHTKQVKRSLKGIWYIKESNEWILATDDHFVEIWILDFHSKETFYLKREFKAHKDNITSCICVSNSRLLATASLDGMIKLWDLEEYELITELRDVSVFELEGSKKSGVRHLSYTTESGGNLLSVGFQSYINVWSPDTSLSKSFVGRLEGHSGIVVDCKTVGNTPYCVSVDDKFNIRVWDLRSFLTIQMIRSQVNSKINFITCLETIPKEDKFVLGGKRLQIFNNNVMKKTLKNFNDEISPLYCEFNRYYKSFLVLTK